MLYPLTCVRIIVFKFILIYTQRYNKLGLLMFSMENGKVQFTNMIKLSSVIQLIDHMDNELFMCK